MFGECCCGLCRNDKARAKRGAGFYRRTRALSDFEVESFLSFAKIDCAALIYNPSLQGNLEFLTVANLGGWRCRTIDTRGKVIDDEK